MPTQKPLCRHCRTDRVGQWKNVYCSKRCAWLARGGAARSRESLPKANAVRHARYVARLRQRIAGLTPAQLWQKAYAAGFNACYQGYLRKVRRGDVIMVKERRRYDWEAA